MSKPKLEWEHDGEWYAMQGDSENYYYLEQIDDGVFWPHVLVDGKSNWVANAGSEAKAKAACERHWESQQ